MTPLFNRVGKESNLERGKFNFLAENFYAHTQPAGSGRKKRSAFKDDVSGTGEVAAKERGLKENVIMGRLIPAGTGLLSYRSVPISVDQEGMLEERLSIQAVAS